MDDDDHGDDDDVLKGPLLPPNALAFGVLRTPGFDVCPAGQAGANKEAA